MVSAYYIIVNEKAKHKIELSMCASSKKYAKEKSLFNYMVAIQLQKMTDIIIKI